LYTAQKSNSHYAPQPCANQLGGGRRIGLEFSSSGSENQQWGQARPEASKAVSRGGVLGDRATPAGSGAKPRPSNVLLHFIDIRCHFLAFQKLLAMLPRATLACGTV